MECKVIALSTNKGGVLKSSVCANLSGCFQKMGKKVLIIDMDNQGNQALTFGKVPNKIENTIHDVLVGGLAAEAAIIEVYPGIDLLPSNKEMRFFEKDLTELKGSKLLRLKNACDHLRKEYDVILIDSPPTLGSTQGNILAFADFVLIPFQPEVYSRLSLVEIVSTIKEIEPLNKDLKILGILPTLVDRQTSLHSEMLAECRKWADKKGYYSFDTVIPRSIRFADEVKKKGLPATLSLPKHHIVQLYFELAKEIEAIW